MLRRLSKDQPASFEFTPANLEWAQGQMTKYPEGRQQSAIIPVLWRAQEQEGWLSRPAIEYCANLLGMPYIRALEVATFYFMFQLQPVGSVAHIQICGTTTCMICGAEDLIRVCREKISPEAHGLSADGRFSWEEVECLGACANAPMVQIGKDFYEDLTAEKLSALIDGFSGGAVPAPGSQTGRFSSEPVVALTSLADRKGESDHNASVAAALRIGDTIKRIDGTEVPILTKWKGANQQSAPTASKAEKPATKAEAPKAEPQPAAPAQQTEGTRPQGLDAARDGKADDLKLIKGVGPKLEALLNSLGFWHFDQIAAWTADELAWVDSNLEGFHGRASRDEWVSQARLLAAGGETEFSRRAEKDGIYD
ncbi:NADH-quinone oxidoreductase subunit NuoE [Paracoccus sp. M683]|uniref:NADH-quinone oxidoreductase subunit NuoE n=1 Tax=Paracoccus sp. M683 TaxID=2594268 RepID=UPI00117FDB6F|nr:NADH-quinone oxidoreductase subunit NuoE [Paracoccus sp. M683]TRW97332.1 NADH-quinone oxidoreductase subunit NuoE [Paracoccus sp. M683]